MFKLTSLETSIFSWEAALSLAYASKVSYENEAIIQNIVTNSWGFSSVSFFDLNETQGFLAHTNEQLLIAFRGTKGLGDWLGNLDVRWVNRPYGQIHNGFYEAYRNVHDKIVSLLAQVDFSNKNIWLTGHSLGGAIATIASAELKNTIPIKGIYTFGQPRLGDTQSKQYFNSNYSNSFFRFVNNDDLVTRIPPGFQHVGDLIRFDEHGNIQKPAEEDALVNVEPTPLTESEFKEIQEEIIKIRDILGQPDQEGVLDDSIEGLFPSLGDHSLDRYISAIRQNIRGVFVDSNLRSEEGDLSFYEGARIKNIDPNSAIDLLPVLLRVNENWRTPDDLKVNSRFGSIVSAQVTHDQLKLLEQNQNVISIEASRDAGIEELENSIPHVGANEIHRPPIAEKGDAAIVGVIDSGVDVLHEAFRNEQGKTRIIAIWNQRDSSGPTPKKLDPDQFTQDYGTLYTADNINEFMNGSQTPPNLLRDPSGHGTHVASIASGRNVHNGVDGMAPDAKLVVVVPNMKTSPGDPPSVGYSVSHVDALHFLKKVSQGQNKIIQEALPIAVNVSLGMNAGAHDGTSTLEAAFDSITDMGKYPGFVIVKSAGNERGHSGHARIRAFNGIEEIRWVSLDQFRFQDYFEVWYHKFDELEFTLIDPAGNRSDPISRENPSFKQALGGNLCAMELTYLHHDNGDNRLVIMILPRDKSIQPGQWTLKVHGIDVNDTKAHVDMWVERDGSRAVRFAVEEPKVTVSIPGTALTVITVSACVSQDPLEIASFSSYGTTRDGRPKPDICAPGENITAASSNQADPRAVRIMDGTSMAAPYVTGALALVLSHRHKQTNSRQYNARQLQAALVRNAKQFRGVHHEGFGYGMLDAAKFFECLK